MRNLNICLLAASFGVAAGGLFSSNGYAADTGTIEGQIVLDGKLPELAPKVREGDQTAKDAAVCAKEGVPNEELVVDPKTNSVANVVIYLRKAPAGMPAAAKASASKEVEFDQKGCRYLPHVLTVRTDQTVMCVSNDAVSHNVHTNPFSNQAKNFIVTPNAEKGTPVEMPQTENLPVRVTCDIHPWMESYWVVTDHPYVAVTDAEGKFKIENLPVGKHKFTVWQESAGYINRNFEVTVKKGDNELPAIKVPLAKFKLKK